MCKWEKLYCFKKLLHDYRKRFTIAHELGHFYMPWHSELMFGCDISEMDIANCFEVSFQAALNRCIDMANEDCMVVCSAAKRVRWFKATEGFPCYIRGKKICEQSCADELADLQSFQTKTVEEPGYVWFANADDKEIVEESIIFPSYGEVISILHLKDEY